MSCCGGARLKGPAQTEKIPDLNAAAAIYLAERQGMKTADSNTIDRRINQCKQCPYFKQQESMCSRCGCILVGKVGKAIESCPLKRW